MRGVMCPSAGVSSNALYSRYSILAHGCGNQSLLVVWVHVPPSMRGNMFAWSEVEN